ncbi:MAG TPA: GPP34 family phosphoprotein [Micromonosporaceae bacterium]|jgi:Golgi phosphoprotein 3 (GPP34)
MPLADNFFLLVHDGSGRSLLHSRATAYGLAASVLLDLAGTGHIVLRQRLVIARSSIDHPAGLAAGGRIPPPATPLLHHVWEQIQRERQPLDVRTWLAALAPTITDTVGERLGRAGLVRVQEVGVVRRSHRYVPVDRLASAKISAILGSKLASRARLDWDDVLLAGLASATGLQGEILATDQTGAGQAYLGELFQEVRQRYPDILMLFTETEAAVGDAVITHRS